MWSVLISLSALTWLALIILTYSIQLEIILIVFQELYSNKINGKFEFPIYETTYWAIEPPLIINS